MLQGRLRGGETGDGDAVRRAAYQVQTDFVAELNGTGVAAVFAANTDHQIRPCVTAFLHRNPHQTAHALAVEHGKGVILQDMLVNIGREELALGVVTAEPRNTSA